MKNSFVPCTRAIAIGDGVHYRPIRSFGTNAYAGERLTIVKSDRSGCMFEEEFRGFAVAPIPRMAIHRVYWHERDAEAFVSAFLSYPGAMGTPQTYFWEVLLGETERFDAEETMEQRIREWFIDREAKDARIRELEAEIETLR